MKEEKYFLGKRHMLLFLRPVFPKLYTVTYQKGFILYVEYFLGIFYVLGTSNTIVSKINKVLA